MLSSHLVVEEYPPGDVVVLLLHRQTGQQVCELPVRQSDTEMVQNPLELQR